PVLVEIVPKFAADELGAVVGEDRSDIESSFPPFPSDQVDETDHVGGVGTASDDVHVGDAGAGVDGSELPDLADAFEFADVETVHPDHGGGCRRPQTEPERAVAAVVEGGVGYESRSEQRQ